ncbi:MAG: hypothetical protein ABI560_18650, partial [Myxococcales bacterium]
PGSGQATINTAGETVPLTIPPMSPSACVTDGGGADGFGSGGSRSGGSGGGMVDDGGFGGSAGTGGAIASGGNANTGGSTGTGGSAGGAGAGGNRSGGTAGGAGKGSGGTGTGGSSTGGAGMGGAGIAPSLRTCREFDHNMVPGCVGGSNSVNSVAISPDGLLVATAGNDGRIKIWRFDGRALTATGTVLTPYAGPGLAFSPDGTRLAAVAGTTVRLWTVANWVAGAPLQGDGSNNDFVGVGFTPDSRRVVSADQIGFAGGSLYVHDTAGTGLPAFTQHVIDEPVAVAVSPRAQPDGSVGVVVTSWYGTAAVFTLASTGGFAASMVIPVSANKAVTPAVRFSPDGSFFATGADDTLVRFWNFPATSIAAMGADIRFGGSVNAIAFAPDGKTIVAAGTFGNPLVGTFNVTTRAAVGRYVPTSDADSIAFSPNGAAVVGGEDECGKVFVCAD